MTSSVDEANQPEGPSEYESPSFYYEKKQEEARKAAEDSQIDQDVLPEMTKSFNTSAKVLMNNRLIPSASIQIKRPILLLYPPHNLKTRRFCQKSSQKKIQE